MDALFVLGMHRSGTSCLASCLEACGLFLGSVNRRPGSADNPYGTFEPFEVAEINEDLLGSWIRPRLPVRPKPEAEERIARCVEAMTESARAAGRSRVGLKDPRLLLVLPHWRRHFERVDFVGSFRGAEAVHRSIEARGQLRTWRRANLKAWKTYNLALLELCAHETVHLVSFDLDPEAYVERLRQVCGAVGLEFDEAEVRRRFDPAVRRQDPEPPRDPEIADIQARLEAAADLSPETRPR